ncbi:B2 protein-like [Dioscorea cayenensis subsp. rotundata]|uniref:B2 protein-like n=1 Tax=Dioscorea cayennensis subsp. rotundata TaxID=55577 RepID=A0AB40AKI1_DIOCR|nr:B2 protein-like [Dioscorea cayenensis subsp. rotundata]XP_039115464.1 B2 protein-like [Dioscorea cayenensis subsp. rotundata]XP_039115465.1 B2 protein-like [Dioscorea cayenensis subsp. rotundata]XP_039115466.1 B2 protein-like [Dioscorea cayenensis subsp. rotundata]
MEHDMEKNPYECDSTLTGAIFMSNRATKKECLKRGVFGLPQSQAKFVSEVKAGMLLFLFEHEERKLYGVFEATSDGAMNIIPNAFRSSGMLFPAQIIFKRIWACKPLCESEFGDCIRENYYTLNKFHFGLSLKQVMRLLGLFSLKKINVGEPQNLISKSSVVKTKSIGKDALLDT